MFLQEVKRCRGVRAVYIGIRGSISIIIIKIIIAFPRFLLPLLHRVVSLENFSFFFFLFFFFFCKRVRSFSFLLRFSLLHFSFIHTSAALKQQQQQNTKSSLFLKTRREKSGCQSRKKIFFSLSRSIRCNCPHNINNNENNALTFAKEDANTFHAF